MAQDITKTGPLTYRELQQVNAQYIPISKPEGWSDESWNEFANRDWSFLPENYHNVANVMPVRYTPQELGAGEDIGSSNWNKESYSMNELADYQDIRALNQGSFMKLVNGITKGAGLAATTFTEGTAGVVAGLINGAANKAEGKGFWEGFVNNPVSQAMTEINSALEEYLPNYRTKDEIENPLALRNIFSMNTLADTVLKNFGFMVGAYYSGGVFMKGLKAIGMAGKMSKGTASLVGSVYGALGEGMIEGNTVYNEMKDGQTQILNNALFEQLEQLNAADPEYQEKRQLLLNNYEKGINEIEDNAQKASAMTFALNIPILTVSNWWQWGHQLSRGFRPKVTARKGLGDIAKDGTKFADRIKINPEAATVKGQNLFETDFLTGGQRRLKAVGKGLSEGLEESEQRVASTFATNLYSPESYDAFYNALSNPEYQVETQNGYDAFCNSVADAFGTQQGWQEFMAGFIGGMVGMPTFGRANNSSSETWLNKGGKFGFTGGYFGAMQSERDADAKAAQHVDALNKFAEKYKSQRNFFTRNLAFQDDMDGFVEEEDEFNYNNSADNVTFNGINAFGATGRMDYLKAMVNQDYDNYTEEQLRQIIEDTKDSGNTWTMPDGSSMVDSEEGIAKMKQILNEHKEQMLDSIKDYEESISEVRGATQDVLDEDQIAELAWLNWKTKRFKTRASSIISQDQKSYEKMRNAIIRRKEELDSIDDDSLTDDEKKRKKENRNVLSVLQAVTDTLHRGDVSFLTDKDIKGYIKAAVAILNDDTVSNNLFNSAEIDAVERKKVASRLRDLYRLGTSIDTFTKKYEEYMENPENLQKARTHIDDENKKENEEIKTATENDSVKNQSVENLRETLKGKTAEEIKEYKKNLDEENQKKVDVAVVANSKSEAVQSKIGEITDQQLQADVAALQALAEQDPELESLGNNMAVQENEITSFEAFAENMGQNIDPSELQKRYDNAASKLNEIYSSIDFANLEQQYYASVKLEDEVPQEILEQQEEPTGKDGNEKAPTVNAVKTEEAQKQKQKELAQQFNEAVRDLIGSYVAEKIRKREIKGEPEQLKQALWDLLASLNGLNSFNKKTKNTITNLQSYQKAAKLVQKPIEIKGIVKDFFDLKQNYQQKATADENETTEKNKAQLKAREEKSKKAVKKPKLKPVSTTNPVTATQQQSVSENEQQEPIMQNGGFTNEEIQVTPNQQGFLNAVDDNTTMIEILETLLRTKGKPIGSLTQEEREIRNKYERYFPDITEDYVEQKKKINTYLSERGVYNRLKTPATDVGKTIYFATDETLNDEVGENVILILNEKNEILGHLPLDYEVRQSRTSQSMLRLKQSFNFDTKSDIGNNLQKFNNTKTTVSRLWNLSVTKVRQYERESGTNTIADIFGDHISEAQIGIVDNAGQLISATSAKIKSTEALKPGHAYLLLKSSLGYVLPLNTKDASLLVSTQRNSDFGQMALNAIRNVVRNNVNADTLLPVLSSWFNIQNITLKHTMDADNKMSYKMTFQRRNIGEIASNVTYEITFSEDGDIAENLYNAIADIKIGENGGVSFNINTTQLSNSTYKTNLCKILEVGLPKGYYESNDVGFMLDYPSKIAVENTQKENKQSENIQREVPKTVETSEPQATNTSTLDGVIEDYSNGKSVTMTVKGTPITVRNTAHRTFNNLTDTQQAAVRRNLTDEEQLMLEIINNTDELESKIADKIDAMPPQFKTLPQAIEKAVQSVLDEYRNTEAWQKMQDEWHNIQVENNWNEGKIEIKESETVKQSKEKSKQKIVQLENILDDEQSFIAALKQNGTEELVTHIMTIESGIIDTMSNYLFVTMSLLSMVNNVDVNSLDVRSVAKTANELKIAMAGYTTQDEFCKKLAAIFKAHQKANINPLNDVLSYVSNNSASNKYLQARDVIIHKQLNDAYTFKNLTKEEQQIIKDAHAESTFDELDLDSKLQMLHCI